MSKLMSLEKIENRIKMVVELTDNTKYTSLKALAEDSEMPKYQLQALLHTKFLFKSGGIYHCITIYNYHLSISLEKMFFSELAEAVQHIYRHRESSYLKDVYEVQYNYERILESAEKKIEETQKELDKAVPERGIIISKKPSFWAKLKNFFKWLT